MKAERTGKCWCGCGHDTNGYWSPKGGHDLQARTALYEIVYGGNTTADVLAMLGYGPDNSIIASSERLERERRGN